MRAYIFPGQGAQFPGMGLDLYNSSQKARDLFSEADRILGFRISEVMFQGTEEDLRQTRVTQPAVYIHSVISALCQEDLCPDMMAGHSLGEFSALTVAGSLSFGDGLGLVAQRAMAMQKACEAQPSTMAAVLGLEADAIERICRQAVAGTQETCVAANFNAPGQTVISGTLAGVTAVCEALKAAGARRALPLKVGGAFHSPLMLMAQEELEKAILSTRFNRPSCPVYQNYDAMPHTDTDEIRRNLVLQLTGSVRWQQSVERMISDGATEFIECGPGKVLQGLVRKISSEAVAHSIGL